ncbi:hypothetical protein IMSAG025_00093 [Muribaculaceae bacterium]|nr:hypothetical protein IMSAG025_00093 [Muribaculaceae bacterium]
MAHRPFVDLFPGTGQNGMADPVPGISLLQIGTVRTPGNPSLAKPFQNLLPLHAEQRADDAVPLRLHTRKPPDSRPPEKMEQHGLRLVVSMMAYGYPAAAGSVGFLPKDLIAAYSSRLLKSQLLLQSPFLHFTGNAFQGNPPFPTELFHKPLIPQSFLSTNAMIYMNCRHFKIQLCL